MVVLHFLEQTEGSDSAWAGRVGAVRTTCATDGNKAVEAFENSLGSSDPSDRFDVILMDCLMPNCDGYEATRRIRAVEAANHVSAARNSVVGDGSGTGGEGAGGTDKVAGGGSCVPVIGLTANAHTDSDRMCYEAGMQHVLHKPLQHADLIDMICTSLASREAPTTSMAPDQLHLSHNEHDREWDHDRLKVQDALYPTHSCRRMHTTG